MKRLSPAPTLPVLQLARHSSVLLPTQLFFSPLYPDASSHFFSRIPTYATSQLLVRFAVQPRHLYAPLLPAFEFP